MLDWHPCQICYLLEIKLLLFSKILCIQINLPAAKNIFATVSSGWLVMQNFEEKNVNIVLLRHTVFSIGPSQQSLHAN